MLFTVIQRHVWAFNFFFFFLGGRVFLLFVFCFFKATKTEVKKEKFRLPHGWDALVPRGAAASTGGVWRCGRVTVSALKARSCQPGARGAPPRHMEGPRSCCAPVAGAFLLHHMLLLLLLLLLWCVPSKHKPSQGAGAAGAPLSHLLCQGK